MAGPALVEPTALSDGDGAPIAAGRFHSLMKPLGPFGPRPRIAIAVSGGADSMALACLAHAWARRRGGEAVALTVDHRLRSESAAEARQVAAWCKALGMGHHTLVWRRSSATGGGVQAAARAARIDLLGRWCRRAGVLHLLLAHHQDDQAETVLERLAAGSGVDGLAGMSRTRSLGVAEGGGVRLLRPLLGTPAEDLEATLKKRRQPWIDDPSNRKSQYARARLGAARRALAMEGLTPARLARTAGRAGRDRTALEAAVAAFLADHARLSRFGHVTLSGAPWGGVPMAILVRAMARIVTTTAGAAMNPPLGRVEALLDALGAPQPPRSRTLGGCRMLWHGGALLAVREAGRIGEVVSLTPGTSARWDGRFDIRLSRGARGSGSITHLSREAIATLRRELDGEAFHSLVGAAPAAVRTALPVFRGLDGRLTVPHLGYKPSHATVSAVFRPAIPLSAKAFDAQDG